MDLANYTCEAVVNNFIAESGRYNGELYRKVAPTGPWLTGTPRGEWQDGMGKILNNILFERVVPSSSTAAPGNGDNKWTDEVFSDSATSTDACLPTPERLDWGQTSRSYRVQARNLQTPEFCVEDLRSDHDIVNMVNALLEALKFATAYVWEDRNRSEYIRLSDHKVTEGSVVGFDIDGQTAFDASAPPVNRLLVGTLERIHEALIADGAYQEGSVGRSKTTDTPVFELYTDAVTMRDLIRQDPDLRDDFRYAYMGAGDRSPLIKTLGAPFSYAGFQFINDPYPERYNVVGGSFVRVLPFKDPTATTKGVKVERNPAYNFAQYQISVVHIPQVYKQLVKKPINSIGKLKFNPVNYAGDFQVLNILDRVCNPRGTKPFLDAIFASASEPGLTHLGWSILHQRCPATRRTHTGCYS